MAKTIGLCELYIVHLT